MTEQRHVGESAVRAALSASGATKCCAYNQTRERFLCADVEVGDFPASVLDTHLPALTPGCGKALWIIPFRGISPSSVRAPIDLIYLDPNGVVLDAVESFPISTVSGSSRPAASVVALPGNTIASVGTRRGDQLMLSPPDEMKVRLQRMLEAKTESQSQQNTASGSDPALRGAGKVLPWVDRSRPRPYAGIPTGDAAELYPASAPPMADPEQTSAAAPTEPAQAKAKPAKSWLQRLLSPDPPQPRKAQRETIHGLAAYFFTGGQSAANAVRDISATGFYVFTTERWYPGTIVRMTLTDRGQPGAERSITVNACVMRWGNDGVGLKFVLQDEKHSRHAHPYADVLMGGASKAEVAEFLARLKSSTN